MKASRYTDSQILAILKQSTAAPGQVVIARYDDDVTVKELRIDNGDVVLVPANDDHVPIRIPAELVTIEGVYAGLVRESGH